MAARFEWKAISRGDNIVGGAVLAGRTKSDGDVYVGKNKNGEVGKLNLNNGTMNNIWTHEGGSTQDGEILVVTNHAPIMWVKVRKGDPLPSDAVLGGNTSGDGDVYPCRSADSDIGKLNLEKGKVCSFWYHGAYFAKTDGEVLCVGPVPESGSTTGGGGYSPALTPSAPAPAPSAPAAPPAHDPANYNADAMCDGMKAGDRVKWLVQEKGMKDADAVNVVMTEFGSVFSAAWLPDAMCDGVSAQDRAQWLVDNQGLTMCAAKDKVRSEFKAVFADWWKPDAMCDGVAAKERAQWLVDNKSLSMEAAKQQVRNEFPAAFGGGGDGPVIDCKFPHTMSVVQTPEGPKLKFAVTCTKHNPADVTMIAFHYTINDGASMNFDVNQPTPGTHTFVHTTPPGGGYSKCPPGAKVKYWLCAKVKGLLSEEPEGACPHPDRRLFWTAP